MPNISNLPHNQRPRERLLSLGAQAISTQDLLSIVLGSGSKVFPVDVLAKQVVTAMIEHRGAVPKDALMQIRGLGFAKICSLIAVFELAERLQEERNQSFGSPETVVSFLQELQGSQREMLIGLYLNARYQLVKKEVLAIGSLNQTILQPRDVFSPIMQFPIAYIILAHNHPSGDPKPSEDDKEFTIRMQEAGELLGVDLLDHIIIARKGRFSFKEEKYL